MRHLLNYLFVTIIMVSATSVDKWLLPALVKPATNLPVVTYVGDRFYMLLHCTDDVIYTLAMRINVKRQE